MNISNNISIINFLFILYFESFVSSIEKTNFKNTNFILDKNVIKYKTIDLIKIVFWIRYCLLDI